MAENRKMNDLERTAEKLFFKHGVRRITVEEICSTADVSKVTFYKHFRNKKELAEKIGNRLLDMGFAEFDRIDELDIAFPDKVRLMTEWKVKFFSKINSEFLSELISIESIREEGRRRFIKNFLSAREKGEIREDLTPEFIWLVIDKLNELITDGSWREVCRDYENFQRQMRSLTFWGMLTRESDREKKGEE